MYIAIAVSENTPQGRIPELLEQAEYLLLMDMEQDRALQSVDSGGLRGAAREAAFARQAERLGCAALVSGSLGEQAFAILAAADIPCYNGYCFHAGQIRRLMYTGDLPPMNAPR